MSDKKIKILTISDHPLSPSGVGSQTKYILEHLLSTGKYSFISLAGAVKHEDYKPQKTKEWEDDWIIYPVDGYGNQETVRSMIVQHRPDILWFMTDPRFYEWLWNFEDEIRAAMPMVYYHVWDNFPSPKFNAPFYNSNDYIATISKVTSKIVQEVAPEVTEEYIPHAVNSIIFRKHTLPSERAMIRQIRKDNGLENKFVCFWNNRNARRKMSGSLVWWWKTFCDEVGHDKAALIMHTEVKDPNGQDLEALIKELNLTDGQVLFSQEKMPPDQLARIYNMVDCTINIADAEGFGLATFESLSCGTPIIVTMTGGLQEQVTDGKEWFGIGLEPTSKSIIGSQEVPFIYEDRISKEDFLNAIREVYNMSKEDRDKMGEKGRQHVIKNYNFKDFKEKWVDELLKVHEEAGSWEARKNYKAWTMREVA